MATAVRTPLGSSADPRSREEAGEPRCSQNSQLVSGVWVSPAKTRRATSLNLACTRQSPGDPRLPSDTEVTEMLSVKNVLWLSGLWHTTDIVHGYTEWGNRSSPPEWNNNFKGPNGSPGKTRRSRKELVWCERVVFLSVWKCSGTCMHTRRKGTDWAWPW